MKGLGLLLWTKSYKATSSANGEGLGILYQGFGSLIRVRLGIEYRGLISRGLRLCVELRGGG